MDKTPKVCVACGRAITYRAKWARDWAQVKYCSQRCRQNKPTGTDRALEDAIVTLLEKRAHGASICPSEAARIVSPEAWRPLMERTRMAARRLVHARQVQITQKGRVADPSTAKGPIRIRLVRGVQ